MDRVTAYICELLYRYECVIIPDFGAFLTRRKPARVDDELHVFYPPSKMISFNKQLNNNDGLLANHIAVSENLTYEEGVAKVQRYVFYLKDRLSQESRIKLNGIGYFFISEENTIQFIAENTTNYLTESFGLSTIVALPISRNVLNNKVEMEQKIQVLNAQNEQIQTESQRTRLLPLPLIRSAAMITLCIGVAGVLGYSYVNQNYIDSKHGVAISGVENEKTIDRSIQKASLEILNPISTKAFVAEKSLETDHKDDINDALLLVKTNVSKKILLEPTKTKKKYHIIAGAYRLLENAQRRIQTLKEKGFDAYLIGVNAYGLHQIAYEGFDTRSAAFKALKKIKKEESRQAWVFIDKTKK